MARMRLPQIRVKSHTLLKAVFINILRKRENARKMLGLEGEVY